MNRQPYHPRFGAQRPYFGAAVFGLAAVLLAGAVGAQAQVVANSPYQVAVFAQAPAGLSQPDSIVQWRDNVIVGFENHVAKDGSDGKFSNIVEFTRDGSVRRMFKVQGHNDGLRLVGEDMLWALQNEDANPNLVVIDLRSGLQTSYTFPATPHGGGYDDIVVKDGSVYLTASNPNLDANGVNDFPALVKATLVGATVMLQPVLYGNATATDLTSGKTVHLNLTDPDSMTMDARGNIVFVSQADSVLVFVHHPLEGDQSVGVLPLNSTATGPGGALITIDDTAFVPHGSSTLLVTDINAGAIYSIRSAPFGFEPGQGYSASDTAGIVGTLNLDTGIITPIVTGFGSARGLLFVLPEGAGEAGRQERAAN